ncbi:uncharacterized protein Z520_12264 [Fonsecaea multimorphosa CBS 102226]|uniref:Uncharacterized protein n=1 Tax=Fonsecaea multimorphosa CBS 102226 TaxID=1442371 RepID=A0A0D2K6Q7_9EURO|nr:uncharacterized protein Z520_12264 [Fonsecaea multimorphosa CBS 102226]KIX92048.1 hypothetical protein Z520_12264 [Fonsecaea multimorphosa CBS 102226]
MLVQQSSGRAGAPQHLTATGTKSTTAGVTTADTHIPPAPALSNPALMRDRADEHTAGRPRGGISSFGPACLTHAKAHGQDKSHPTDRSRDPARCGNLVVMFNRRHQHMSAMRLLEEELLEVEFLVQCLNERASSSTHKILI